MTTGFERDKHDGRPSAGSAEPPEGLPFCVELWQTPDDVARVLGRASSAALARAIFDAAITENPGRRVTLRRGAEMLEDSRR